MSGSPLPQEILDLLADYAAGVLSPTDQVVLQDYLAKNPIAAAELAAYEQGATTLWLSAMLSNLPIDAAGPPALSEVLANRLEREANAFFAGKAAANLCSVAPTRSAADLTEVAVEIPSGMAKDAPVPSSRTQSPILSRRFALAASVLGGMFALTFFFSKSLFRSNDAIKLASLLRNSPGVIQLNWSKTEHPSAIRAQGEILWSDELQQGVMRFEGLPANDPSKQQYQLWIFDSNRPAETPVDGGVFDITKENSGYVAVNAKLKVAHPTLFAITIEKPGGVVVSTRKDLALLAKVPENP